ncbi:MAG: ATP-dependent transcriptional activator MalT [Candidatus Accumulibacter phosphatis]|uniref:ATP-dependent transcriptional activator MalT n=1 Tax=Candidatus Accumulibacter phosphatis TaxID=327160 RepID=A0A080LU89_9PROT|nr:LuxR C-terminal-related transcriptional regulator [Accumulibacter sp.]KFB72061.1 MAG: ATP-dependent transcriptional activator MalT [Candidatus Accumulibacter phosphatis]HRF11104.1 LuxR C-terminal-related transcriptional regulator [Candidatus Accumulibacter phosphatis]
MPLLQIVRSKLQRPRASADFVARSELLARLEAGSNRPLTLLVAPAGYGKTALVTHWLAGRDGLAAWLSLDHEDSDPIVFIRYFAAALRTAIPDACAETLAYLDAGQQTSLTVLAGSLSNDLAALPVPLVMVLDDYHRIDSPPIHALLDRLLVHPASALHLLVIARHDPPLSLGALRVREEMNEIRMRDLQFGEREAAILLERCVGRTVSAAALARLQACSEGWPVGVRLAALALRNKDAADALGTLEHCFSGSTREVEQYFCEEVLAQQSVLARDCLLRTSILDRFCASLCDAVLGDACNGHALMQLVSSGALLCIPIDDRLEWYRHQRLFREFLQRQLELQYPASEIAALHRRAAAWFETQDFLEEAIPHALAASGAVAAGHLLARNRQRLLNQEQRQRLERCLRLLPPDSVAEDPELLLLKAWLMYHQGRHVETPAVLDRIEVLLESAAGGLPAVSALCGSVSALRSLQYYLEGRADMAIRSAEQALQGLPIDCAQARVLAQAVIAGTRQMRGDLVGARQSLHAALARASGPIDVSQAPLLATLCFIDWMAADLSALQWTANQHYPLGEDRLRSAGSPVLGRYFHGLVQYQRNELALAEATLLPALAPQPVPRPGYRTEVTFVLAAVYQALGQTSLAREIVDTVCEHLQRNGDSPALFRAQACQADLALRQGRSDAAREWARNFDPGPVQFVYRFSNAPHLTLARVWIAEGSVDSHEQAARLLQLLETEMMARHNVRFLIEVVALQALLRHLQGEETVACELLGRAVALAQPGGFIRLFVDLGQDLVPPLKRLQTGQSIVGNAANARYVGQILAAFNDDWLVSAGRQQVGADLTRRELKILKLLAVRLSNIEISEELCISRATVKRHTQNIYRKLRASSRREAVFRARTLNLLADA